MRCRSYLLLVAGFALAGFARADDKPAVVKLTKLSATAPVAAMVLVFQRRIVQGLTAGAVKG